MVYKNRTVAVLSFFVTILFAAPGYSKESLRAYSVVLSKNDTSISFHTDTVPPPSVMEIVKKVVLSLDKFNINDVANLYTHNAVVADDEPPYSWNGPTAGVQWVNAVEKVCKENELTKLKGTMGEINICQQNADNVYIVVPVNYTGNLPHGARFVAKGAFAFVLRMENGSWLIKSQVWIPKRAL